MNAPASPVGSPLKVAYLVNQYPKVSHSFIRREILALERRGIEVHRFAARGWDAEIADPADAAEQARTRYLLGGGLRGLLMPTLRALVAGPARFLRALRTALRLGRRADRSLGYHLVYLLQACALCEWMRAAGVAHLHAHFGTNPAEVALLAHELGGPPYSFTVHGPEEFDKPEALHLAAKVAHAAFVVAISSFGRSQLFRWATSPSWNRIEVVHCGLDAEFLVATAAEPVANERFVCVGRLCEQKGQLLLVEAVARMVEAGRSLQLVLAGDGEMRGAIEACIRERRLDDHVRITGWISGAQVRSELLDARALVLPSFAEGLPVVIMEAMALGRPVLSTYVAGIPELVRHGEEGWLFPAGDVEALVAAMTQCLDAPVEDLARRGRAARLRVRERHDVDTAALQLAALFGPSARLGRA